MALTIQPVVARRSPRQRAECAEGVSVRMVQERLARGAEQRRKPAENSTKPAGRRARQADRERNTPGRLKVADSPRDRRLRGRVGGMGRRSARNAAAAASTVERRSCLAGLGLNGRRSTIR